MSSVITSLTPNQVNDELNKMQSFIKKEAEEKAKEIQLKADQEYEIEKSSIVRNETNNIDLNFESKLKKAVLKQQITKSTIANKMRLKILSTREQTLNEIFDKAKKELVTLTKNKKEYQKFLHGLVLEAASKLLEPKVIVRAKKADATIISNIVNDIAKEFETLTEQSIEIEVSDDYLSEETIGGVIVSDSLNKIEVNNTLEERLQLLTEEALPGIRLELFGPSKTRKFYD